MDRSWVDWVAPFHAGGATTPELSGGTVRATRSRPAQCARRNTGAAASLTTRRGLLRFATQVPLKFTRVRPTRDSKDQGMPPTDADRPPDMMRDRLAELGEDSRANAGVGGLLPGRREGPRGQRTVRAVHHTKPSELHGSIAPPHSSKERPGLDHRWAKPT